MQYLLDMFWLKVFCHGLSDSLLLYIYIYMLLSSLLDPTMRKLSHCMRCQWCQCKYLLQSQASIWSIDLRLRSSTSSLVFRKPSSTLSSIRTICSSIRTSRTSCSSIRLKRNICSSTRSPLPICPNCSSIRDNFCTSSTGIVATVGMGIGATEGMVDTGVGMGAVGDGDEISPVNRLWRGGETETQKDVVGGIE